MLGFTCSFIGPVGTVYYSAKSESSIFFDRRLNKYRWQWARKGITFCAAELVMTDNHKDLFQNIKYSRRSLAKESEMPNFAAMTRNLGLVKCEPF